VIKIYEEGWHQFKVYIEEKAKDRCIITKKNWARLQEWHLERFLDEKINHPFGFLLRIKIMHPEKYNNIPGMPRMLHFYKELRYKTLHSVDKGNE